MRYRTDGEQIDLASDVLWRELQRTHGEDYEPATRQVWDYRPPHKTDNDQKRYFEARVQSERAAARKDALFYAINVLNDDDLDERINDGE
jgi:hypothetical protein